MEHGKLASFALISTVFAGSIALADEQVNLTVDSQEIAEHYFEANWQLNSGSTRRNGQVIAQATNYFDANWAVFAASTNNTDSYNNTARISTDYFDANWTLHRDDGQGYPFVDQPIRLATEYPDANLAVAEYVR